MVFSLMSYKFTIEQGSNPESERFPLLRRKFAKSQDLGKSMIRDLIIISLALILASDLPVFFSFRCSEELQEIQGKIKARLSYSFLPDPVSV